MHRIDPFDVLGISRTAKDHEIRAAYHKLALTFHPDKQAGKSIEEIAYAAERFKQIHTAFKMLTKPANYSSFRQVPPMNVDHDNMSMVVYESDQLSFEPILALTYYDEYLNSKQKLFCDIYNFDRTDNNLDKIIFDEVDDDNNNDSSYLLPYNSEHLEGLSKEQIQEHIMDAKSHYDNVTNLITDKSFLWIAEKEGCAPIYFMSTNHELNCDLEDRFGDAMDNIIDKVDIVFTEVTETEEESLSDALSDASLPDHIKKKLLQETHDSMDNFIANKAWKQGKELRPLENGLVRETALSMNETSSSIMDFLSKIKDMSNTQMSTSECLTHTRNYLTNICQGEVKIQSDAEVIDFLKKTFNCIPEQIDCDLLKSVLNADAQKVINRNLFWMKSIISVSSQDKKPCLVASGAAHNYGQYGLPNLLASDGYTLTPLMKKAPHSKSAHIRELTFGSDNGFFKPFIPDILKDNSNQKTSKACQNTRKK